MGEWFEIEARGMLGLEDKDMKEIMVLGRLVRWTEDGWSLKQTRGTEKL